MAPAIKRRDRTILLALPGTLVLAVLILVPICEVVVLSHEVSSINYSFTSQVALKALSNTIFISMCVTLASFIVAFPLAYLMVHTSSNAETLILGVVLMSMWLSVLVRSYSWIVLLQSSGALISFMHWLGISAGDSILFNRSAVIIGMTHVLSPYFALAIWNNSRHRSRQYLSLATSLGSSKTLYIVKVFFPSCLPGIAVGAFVTFLLSTGFLVTPELLGGGKGNTMMIGALIDENVNQLGNFSKGAALSAQLLTVVTIIMITIGYVTRSHQPKELFQECGKDNV